MKCSMRNAPYLSHQVLHPVLQRTIEDVPVRAWRLSKEVFLQIKITVNNVSRDMLTQHAQNGHQPPRLSSRLQINLLARAENGTEAQGKEKGYFPSYIPCSMCNSCYNFNAG